MTFHEWYQARFGGKPLAERPSTDGAYAMWWRLYGPKS